MFRSVCYGIIFLSFLFEYPVICQTNDHFIERRIVTAGSHYQAGWLHRVFAGDHWRDLWVQPFEAPVLNLNTFSGGIYPFKTGGGLQTLSLHFKDEKGKRFKFRSIDKDPSRGLPPEMRETLVSDALQDLVTVSNPVSALIVTPIMKEAGAIVSEPFLCILPESEILGEFEDDFSGLLGTMEEHPDTYDDKTMNFAGADYIVETYELFDSLQINPQHKVSAEEFLKLRLIDILIGDRDRHAGQWDWAGYVSSEEINWRPIAKDRDYAFPLYDGIISYFMRFAMTSIVHFESSMPVIKDMTWEGRHLDRRILSPINKKIWDSTTASLQIILSDELIENAVKNMPPEYFSIAGEDLIFKLKSRRDQLHNASNEFYLLAARYVDIFGTDAKDSCKVFRSDSMVNVTLYSSSDSLNQTKVFQREFYPDETVEIRIHLFDGDDVVQIIGESSGNIILLVDAGFGNDTLIDSSIIHRKPHEYIPFIPYKSKTRFYDSGTQTRIVEGNDTYVNTNHYYLPAEVEEKYEPEQENRSYDVGFLFPLGYNSDDGALLGTGIAYTFYDYNKIPYSHKLGVQGRYATKTETAELNVFGDFYNLFEDFYFETDATITGLKITRFYGFGNETRRDPFLHSLNYYQVDQRLFQFSGILYYPFNKYLIIGAGPLLEFSSIEKKEETFLGSSNFRGTEDLILGGLSAQLIFDTRNHIEFPMQGFYAGLSNTLYPPVFNYENIFGKSSLDVRTYYSNRFITDYTIAFRSSAEIAWGEYPFFHSASLGGKKSLRGFPRDRFRGDASVLGQLEFRIKLFDPEIFVPAIFGVNLFVDAGKVFVKGEDSDIWHSSTGAGIWYSLFDRILTISLNFAISEETNRFYLSLSQSF